MSAVVLELGEERALRPRKYVLHKPLAGLRTVGDDLMNVEIPRGASLAAATGTFGSNGQFQRVEWDGVYAVVLAGQLEDSSEGACVC